MRCTVIPLLVAMLASVPARADEALFELAKKTENPIADLATAPLLYNWDGRLGTDDRGTSNYLRFEPVVPLHLSPDWNLITRLYMPMIEQNDAVAEGGTQYGFSGVNLSFFASPTGPVSRGLSIGLGPLIGFPASSSALGSQRWSAGPTAAVMWQPEGPWSVGLLLRQFWSFGGSANDAPINEFYYQPMLSYTTKDAWTLGANMEATYLWTDDEGSAPINVSLTKLVRLGGMALSLGPGVRYWIENPDADAKGWGFRFEGTLVFADGP